MAGNPRIHIILENVDFPRHQVAYSWHQLTCYFSLPSPRISTQMDKEKALLVILDFSSKFFLLLLLLLFLFWTFLFLCYAFRSFYFNKLAFGSFFQKEKKS